MASKKSIIVWLLVLMFGMACDVFAQGRVFYEPGDGSSGAATDCRVTTASRDGVPHRNGSALECGWDGTLGWQDAAKTRELELPSVPMKSERLVRWWFRVDANVDAAPGSKLMRLGYGSPNEIIISCQFENAVPRLWVGVNNLPSFWGGNAPNCRQGWQQLEIYQSPSLIRVWQNDAQIAEWTGALSVSSMVTFLSQWSNNPGWSHDAQNNIYADEIEIFTDAGAGGIGSMRDGTMTQGQSGPLPTNCQPGAPQLVQAVESPECVDGSRVVIQEWTRIGDVPATNGGAACSPIPYTVTTSMPCVIGPPNDPITVITAVKTCRVTVQDAPPDNLGGWGVQFRWDANNFGSRDSSAPFERARDFSAGSYQLGAIWTKTGQTPVYRPPVLYECK